MLLHHHTRAAENQAADAPAHEHTPPALALARGPSHAGDAALLEPPLRYVLRSPNSHDNVHPAASSSPPSPAPLPAAGGGGQEEEEEEEEEEEAVPAAGATGGAVGVLGRGGATRGRCCGGAPATPWLRALDPWGPSRLPLLRYVRSCLPPGILVS